MSVPEAPAHDMRPRDRAAKPAEGDPQRAPRPSGGHHGVAAPASGERLQFSLLVGAVNDPEEREADRLADAVVQRLSTGSALQNPRVVPDGRGSRVRPAPKGGDEPASDIDRVRRSATGAAPASEAVTGDLDALRRSGGRPMDEPLRRRMELGFGADLGAVRLHTGPAVDSLNDRLAARAFTVGSDVFFRGGVPDTTTAAGTHLVAHELAHTMQQTGRVERSVTIRRAPGDDDAPSGLAPGWMRNACEAVAEQIRIEAEADLHKSVFKGLGGGGAGFTRSAEVKMFRGVIKEHARKQAYDDVRAASDKRTRSSGKSATTDYQEMIGGNIAYKKTKKSVDAQLRTEEESLVLELTPELQKIYDAAFAAAEAEVLRGGDIWAAQKLAKKVTKPMHGPLKTEARRLKDTVVGKRGEGEVTDLSALTTAGKGVRARVDQRVSDDKVGERSLKKAIEAPSMSMGLRILAGILDAALSGAGETIDLAIEFSIPTGTPGLVVVIKMSGTAARGTNGATTAGVTTLGNPKRMEVAAKFSVGVGAEAVGIKSDANVGFFVRSGSDKGTDAALQALSYGAYRVAKPELLANLWAPGDKMGKRNARHRAEMWAAMVEQTTFGGGDDTYADIGLSVDGGFGANLPGVKIEATIGAALFSHYDAKSLAASMGGDFADRVRSDKDAKRRRKNVAGEKKLALSASVSFEVGIAGNSVGFALGVSGGGLKNWGAEITATVGMPPGVDSNFVDKLINQYITGVGESVKRLDEIFRKFDEHEPGIYGIGAQLPADAAAVVDIGMENALRDGVKEVATNTVDKSAYDTTLGETFSGGVEQQEVFGLSTQLVFALTFGLADGEFVVRLELRSKRGLEINAGTMAKIEASKTTRLLAIGRDGKKGAVVEIAGLRFDSKDD